MRQHGQREARIGGRQRLEDRHCGGGIEARAPMLLAEGHTEQSKFASPPEKGVIERLRAVVLCGLGLHLPADEVSQRIGEQSVFRGRRKQVEAAPVAIRHRAASLTAASQACRSGQPSSRAVWT